MRYLLDTHILLWAANGELGGSFASLGGLPPVAGEIIENVENELFFSAASIWEISLKAAKGHADFAVDPGQFSTA